tara:strand:- start:1107 stop:1478 length:372 start_codon:yes stop_codon:yes gene_type:complete
MSKKSNKDSSKINDQDYMVMRHINDTKKISQREISQSLNISLGKVNYILKALINKGIIKARNFTNSKNKRAYAYYLTPKGLQEKARLTVSFFDRKSKEYDKLKKELLELEKEIKNTNPKDLDE